MSSIHTPAKGKPHPSAGKPSDPAMRHATALHARGVSPLPAAIRRAVHRARRTMKMSLPAWRAWTSVYCSSPRRLKEWASDPATVGRSSVGKVFVMKFDPDILQAIDHATRCQNAELVSARRCSAEHDPMATIDRWMKLYDIEPYGPDLWRGDCFAVDGLAKHADRVTLIGDVDREGDCRGATLVSPEATGGMLMLTRGADESVTIELPDGRIARVVVTRMKGNQAQLGFDFPRDIAIKRTELLSRPRGTGFHTGAAA